MKYNFQSEIESDLQDHKKWLKSLIQEKEYETEPRRQSPVKNSIKESEVIKQGEPKHHWEYLYNLNQIKQETREFVQNAQKMREDKEAMECTFQPKILDSSLKMAQKYGQIDFHRRGEYWKKEKEEKLKRIQETKQDKELLHCTFQPKILHSEIQKPKEDVSDVKQRSGVEKFLERQRIARHEKQRKLEILNGKQQKEQNV